MITLLIADSHAHYRQALRQLCEVNGGLRVLAETDNGDQAVLLARQQRPDVILLDADLPGLSGLEAARRLTGADSAVRVLLLTLFGPPRLSVEARQAGVWAALPKDC